MHIEKIKKTAPKVSELVMQAILNAVDSGTIKLNEDLLPERELATALDVSRGSLRESLAILEFLGVIEPRGNRKVVVKTSEHLQNVTDLIRLSENFDAVTDFVAFRRVNECAIVELACENATAEDLAKIARCIERMEQDPTDAEADPEFHMTLAMASRNALFATTYRLISGLMMDLRTRFLSKPGYYQKTLSEHRAIYEAVARRDKQAAKRIMKQHLKSILLFGTKGDGVEETDRQ
ncbi:putative GntR family transcriptional regulator [uncultured delta proteobacterium]|uniref:Putative GntR family transcriptional regulator n=1 Tax=uncultured delta proteobacterium TaxID=34034 RepID=A0A212JVE0_9DELT|nr:putative GntR family transcriptional regulator [uncultured delta proteobacterium]